MTRLFLPIFLVILSWTYAQAATIGEDGLHKQEWFSITFKDMQEDMQTAKDEGKRLVIFFEQRGCIYCKKVHEDVLTDPTVSDYIKENYMVVQYNLHGDEEVTDLDGATLSEKNIAKKWGILFTPTVMFMPEEPDTSKNAKDQAVAIMPGAFGKGTFLDMFTWVREKGYEGEEDFQRYHARMINKRREANGTSN